MARKRKRVRMTVTVSIPACFSAADARREVRSLINHQAGYSAGMFDGDLNWQEMEIRAIGVRPSR